MKKPTLKKRKKEVERPTRITNETVAEHREKILAGGRRFKYPRQYARHKLVFNAIIIALVALIVLMAVSWWQLYQAQSTSTFFYKLARIVPVPVATVADTQVRYSDYLLRLRPTLHYLEQVENTNMSSEDGRRKADLAKRDSLDRAITNAYAGKIAKEKNITISSKNIDTAIEASRSPTNGKISQEIYDASTESKFGLTPSEYRQILHNDLLQQEVAYAIDTKAFAAKDAAEKLLKVAPPPTLEALAAGLKEKGYASQLGASGLVPKANIDGGLTKAALELKVGELSKVIRSTSGDGYYIVQLVESNDTQASYAFIRIPLTVFTEQIQALKKNNKIDEYIELSKAETKIQR